MDEEVEAPQKLHRDASEVRVIREADPLPDREPVPQCVEALELEPGEIEVEEEPEPIPEVEPKPALPVVITEDHWEDTPAPEPAAAEPPPAPPAPPAPPSDGWVKGADLTLLVGCSEATINKNKNEGLLDGHWRDPLPGEGRGVRFDPEVCKEARANRPDLRLRKRAKPKPPKPLQITPDALAADPALL